jgi:hypothetical protein
MAAVRDRVQLSYVFNRRCSQLWKTLWCNRALSYGTIRSTKESSVDCHQSTQPARVWFPDV